MKIVGSSEARTHLYDLLRDVEKGESITVTRYGIAVARLIPVQNPIPEATSTAEGPNQSQEGDNARQENNVSIRELTEDDRE